MEKQKREIAQKEREDSLDNERRNEQRKYERFLMEVEELNKRETINYTLLTRSLIQLSLGMLGFIIGTDLLAEEKVFLSILPIIIISVVISVGSSILSIYIANMDIKKMREYYKQAFEQGNSEYPVPKDTLKKIVKILYIISTISFGIGLLLVISAFYINSIGKD